jgi:hypothetical protein
MAKKKTVGKTFIATHVINSFNLPVNIKAQALELNGKYACFQRQWHQEIFRGY